MIPQQAMMAWVQRIDITESPCATNLTPSLPADIPPLRCTCQGGQECAPCQDERDAGVRRSVENLRRAREAHAQGARPSWRAPGDGWRPTPEQCVAYQEGRLTQRELGRMLGLCHHTIRHGLKRVGIYQPGRRGRGARARLPLTQEKVCNLHA